MSDTPTQEAPAKGAQETAAKATPETKAAVVNETVAAYTPAFSKGVAAKVVNTSPGPRVFRVLSSGMVRLYTLAPNKSFTAVVADPENPVYALWLKRGAISVTKAS